ncbi:hypothetical protein RINTHH_14180 [Richelia intracellularis HH01]|jgi:predicted Zn-dependent protease|uniref:Uncharacterized protein n=1 Tax=Richelia intracellularis HH01 TaxID=1165094 RepID=M1X0L4_9NOST|nr:tetratricopeptide repeat protein [Richelia intracellularis]CCH67573.1 hypothetical protein RINTHH_14180 [Richelia intracellularis HH01]
MLDLFAIIAVVLPILSLIYLSVKTWKTNVIFRQAITFYKAKDYANAETYFQQLIAINYTNDLVHLLLGDTLLRQKQLEAAIDKYQEVVKRAPEKVDAYCRLSNALIIQDKRQEAINLLEKSQKYFQSKRQVNDLKKIQQLLKIITES